MKTFKALVKREFWEHKGGIFYTPLIMAAVFAVLLIIGSFTGETIHIDDESFSFSEAAPKALAQLEHLSEGKRAQIMSVYLQWPVVVFGFVLFLVSLFYSLGCLYDERKDRSILFWKSLPISDASTVLSKFVAITILAPLIYFATLVVFQLFLMLYATVGAWIGGDSGGLIWGSTSLLSVVFNTLISLLVASFWLAPVWGWCLLVSTWAKKVAFLWGGIPIVMIIVAEGIISQTTRFAELVGTHIATGFAIQNSFINEVSDGEAFESLPFDNAMGALSSANFWVGLLIAGVFIGGAIYTRRYRDES